MVRDLASELRELGHCVRVVAPEEDEDAFTIPRGWMHGALAVWRFLASEKPDVVHVHAHGSLLPGAVIHRIFHHSCRLVFTFHTQPHLVTSMTTKRLHRSLAQRVVMNCLLRAVDVVTCVSRSLGNNLTTLEGLPLGSFAVVTNGVKLYSTDPIDVEGLKAKLNVTGRFPLVSMIGVLNWDWKAAGIKILMEAMRSVAHVYPDAMLLIVGDGEYRSVLEAKARSLGLANNVLFTGYVDDPSEILAVTDVYAHISLNEACPMAVLEAMSAGLPIVASRAGGIPEVIDDGVTGLLVDNDTIAVSQAIIRLAGDSETRARLGGNAKSAAESRFSWRAVAMAYLRLYRGEQ